MSIQSGKREWNSGRDMQKDVAADVRRRARGDSTNPASSAATSIAADINHEKHESHE